MQTPQASSPEALARMVRQRRRDTGPELALRRELYKAGLRYRVDYALPGLRRRADLAFPGRRVAIFVDGCFWHGCPRHASWPKANAAWWRSKIEANRSRDRDTDARLADQGWKVIRIWEHETAEAAARDVIELVRPRGQP